MGSFLLCFSSTPCMPYAHPSHIPSSDHIQTPGENDKALSSSSYTFLQPVIPSYLLDPNIFVNTLFPKHHDYLNMRDQSLLITKLTHNSFFLYLFIPILYIFRATKCSSSGESIVSIGPLVYVTLQTVEWSKITRGLP